MRILGITALAICWWAGEVAPNWLVAATMLLLWVIVGEIPFQTAFSAFGSTSVWLIIGSFCLAASISKTGLFKRISWHLIRLFSPTFSGQVLALLLCGTICSPLVPSSTAKAVLGASIAKNIADALGYEPNSRGRCGLFLASYIGFGGTAPAFMSGSIHTYMVSDFLSGANAVTWLSWLLRTLPWLAVVLTGSFFLIRILYSPESEAVLTPEYIMGECKKMGKMREKERISALLLGAAVLLWIMESPLKIGASVTAIGIACLCFAVGILDNREISSVVPWGLVIFIGGVLNLGTIFSMVGIDVWLQEILIPVFSNMPNAIFMMTVIALTTMLLHLLLASQTATLVILMTVLTPVAASSGVNQFAIGFIILSMIQCWFLSYQNATFASALSGMMDTLDHRKTVAGGVVFALLSWIGCLANILLWKMIDLL